MTSLTSIKKIGVIGSGTMGAGIGQIAAMSGFEVILYDIKEEQLTSAQNIIVANLEKGITKGKVTPEIRDKALSNIQFTTDLNSVKADFIIEAIVENLEVKKELFQALEKINNAQCILASNTSSIPITQIAAKLQRPDRFVGMHFFNPAHIMKLVEVISGASTSDTTAVITTELAEKFGKTAVQAKDSPGFIVNRVARHFYVEGLKVLEEQVANVEAIDKLVESRGFKMGPFRLMDLIGVDTNFSVTTSMYNSFYQDAKFRPNRIQQQKVDAGHHGKKSGKGFYDYE